jgi:hypothetical protein
VQLINPTISPNQLKTTLTPHRIFHRDACFAYSTKSGATPRIGSQATAVCELAAGFHKRRMTDVDS